MTLSAGAQDVFEKCRRTSENGIAKMRTAAKELFGNDKRLIIGANGSYARREVTSGSDVDLFFLTRENDPKSIISEQKQYRERLTEIGLKLSASDGVFNNPHSVKATSDLIGGLKDKNEHITRRMLLLLEGEWIFNEAGFAEARQMLLSRYIGDDLRDDQICLFLLNDIIRYWRTICVDFEFKIRDGAKPKEIRLVKLRFSRMMLYLAGVLAVGVTYQKPCADKHAVLSKSLGMPPLKRFTHIVGGAGEPALELYAKFLKALDNEAIREKLNRKNQGDEHSEEFKILRQNAGEFRDLIYDLLKRQYSDGNPTLAALML